jgi:ATP-dependent Lon protease
VATGLAWTPTGGEILFIEVTGMPGKGSLTLTGLLGESMRESAQAALSYLRSNAKALGLDPAKITKTDLHIHVPAGAVPKDGPSAGVAISAALISLFRKRAIHQDLAMTGEVTLTGRVLPVGGVREKILAARRAGINTILLPRHNEKDLLELPAEVKADMTFVSVDTLDDVVGRLFPAAEIRREADDRGASPPPHPGP